LSIEVRPATLEIVRKPTKPRVRRSAEEARGLILDAAERQLQEGGPGAIRLQDVADQVGVSHPAILHHFKSREALLQAVVDRAMRNLEADLVKAFFSETGEPPEPAAMLERVFEMLDGRGHARVLAWLVLSGHDTFDFTAAQKSWDAITDGTHAMRRAAGIDASREDTQFTLVLSAFALFAQAIAGHSTFQMAGLGKDQGAPLRFRRWLGALMIDHMERQPVASLPALKRPRRKRMT
jgi:AcrR family transcriptional regulator